MKISSSPEHDTGWFGRNAPRLAICTILGLTGCQDQQYTQQMSTKYDVSKRTEHSTIIYRERCPMWGDYQKELCYTADEREPAAIRTARVKQQLLDFVKKMRTAQAGAVGGCRQIVPNLFREERGGCRQLLAWRECLDRDQQNEIVQAVLEETKLTQKEADQLCPGAFYDDAAWRAR